MAEYVIQNSYSYYPGRFVVRVINIVFGIIEALLALRLILEFLGANAGSPIVAWVYGVTGSLIGPFANAFPQLVFSGFVLDLTTIFAMIGYAFIGWLVMMLLSFVFARP